MKHRIKTIPDTFILHPAISLGAKGLYSLINLKPIEWKGNSHIIACETKDTEDKIESYIAELKCFGYLDMMDDVQEWEEKLYTYTLIDNRVSGRKKIIKESIIKIVAYWNAKWVVVHTKTTPGMEHQIERNLDIYTIEEIYKAIDNYTAVFKSKLTWWEHKWTLEEFLKRQNGMSVFLHKWEADYIDRLKAKTDPKAKAIIAQKEQEIKKKVEEREKEQEKKEVKIDKEALKEFWKRLTPEEKEKIEEKVKELMDWKESLKRNIPVAYQHFEQLARLNETNKLKILYDNKESG